MSPIIEIRSYNLTSGTREAFDRLMTKQALPMLQCWGIDVVACGPSLHDADSYYLIRAYRDLAERQSSQDAFYASAEWMQGPRESILALIGSYTSVVLDLDEGTVDALRQRL